MLLDGHGHAIEIAGVSLAGITDVTHRRSDLDEIRNVAISIDHYVGEIAFAAPAQTLLFLHCGHPALMS